MRHPSPTWHGIAPSPRQDSPANAAEREAGDAPVWELNSYRDFLSENTGHHNVIGSGLLVAAVVSLLLILFA
jgi:hypothetical protein